MLWLVLEVDTETLVEEVLVDIEVEILVLDDVELVLVVNDTVVEVLIEVEKLVL